MYFHHVFIAVDQADVRISNAIQNNNQSKRKITKRNLISPNSFVTKKEGNKYSPQSCIEMYHRREF